MNSVGLLNAENYRQGFLVDEELLAGVTAAKAPETGFMAFVLRHTTGEYLGTARYDQLDEALHAINRIPREWAFDSTHGCGNSECGAAGKGSCPAGGCSKLSRSVATSS